MGMHNFENLNHSDELHHSFKTVATTGPTIVILLHWEWEAQPTYK